MREQKVLSTTYSIISHFALKGENLFIQDIKTRFLINLKQASNFLTLIFYEKFESNICTVIISLYGNVLTNNGNLGIIDGNKSYTALGVPQSQHEFACDV